MKATIHKDFSGNLIIYSSNYLFDRKCLIIDKFDKTQTEDFISLLSKEQIKDLLNGWTITIEIPETHKEVYFA